MVERDDVDSDQASAATPTAGDNPDKLAKLIADKASDPAFGKIAKAWPLRELRFLPIIKMKPCAVSAWYVALPSGEEVIISNEDWEASTATGGDAVAGDAKALADYIIRRLQ